MPHVIIEHAHEVAGEIDINSLIGAVHEATFGSGLFTEYDIKTRALEYRNHQTGQTRDSFVHVAVHLLDGRSEAHKSMLSRTVLARIEPLLPQVVSVGVEICDMHRASYVKRVLGS